jgi:hypothetical protein
MCSPAFLNVGDFLSDRFEVADSTFGLLPCQLFISVDFVFLPGDFGLSASFVLAVNNSGVIPFVIHRTRAFRTASQRWVQRERFSGIRRCSPVCSVLKT